MRPRLVRLAVLATALAGLLGGAGGVTYAAFTATTANPDSTFETMAIFPRDRFATAWEVTDRSSGGDVDASHPLAFDGGPARTTKNWSNRNRYRAGNYLELDFGSPLAAERPASAVELQFRFAATGGRTACFYFEVRRRSDDAVLATYGGGGDVGCVTGSTLTTHTAAIPVVTSTGEANDLRVRIYVRQSGSAAPITIDRAVVAGAQIYTGFLLYPAVEVDRANGTTATTAWPVDTAGDGSWFQPAAAFGTGPDPNRHVTFRFPVRVPNLAQLHAVSVDLSYRAASGTACIHFEVLAGNSVLESVGSSGAPTDCSTAGAFKQVSRALASVTAAAQANDLAIRVYATTSGGSALRFDQVRLNTRWSVDAGAS